MALPRMRAVPLNGMTRKLSCAIVASGLACFAAAASAPRHERQHRRQHHDGRPGHAGHRRHEGRRIGGDGNEPVGHEHPARPHEQDRQDEEQEVDEQQVEGSHDARQHDVLDHRYPRRRCAQRCCERHGDWRHVRHRGGHDRRGDGDGQHDGFRQHDGADDGQVARGPAGTVSQWAADGRSRVALLRCANGGPRARPRCRECSGPQRSCMAWGLLNWRSAGARSRPSDSNYTHGGERC